MTDDQHPGDNGHDSGPPATFVVPSRARSEAPDAELISEAQQARDLGSASRSCVAIIAILLVLALLVCVFLTWALVLR